MYELMKNVVYDKIIENWRNRIDIRLVNNKKDCLKWTSTPSYMSQELFDNDLVAIRKSKVTLTLKKRIYSRSWSLKKWVFGSSWRTKLNIDLVVTSGCLLSRKV